MPTGFSISLGRRLRKSGAAGVTTPRRRADGIVPLASARSTRRSDRARGLPGLGDDHALAPRAHPQPLPAAARGARGPARRDDHRRARQGLLRLPGRDRARGRGGRVRHRRAAAAEGRDDRERRHAGRQPFACASRSGVVAGITPFNFPAMVPMWMFPVALACGNCFILKVSEKVPSAALILAELLHEAGRAGRRVPGRPRRQGGGRRHAAPSRTSRR